MALMVRSSYGYRKLAKEDPEEKKHRKAQFLIYKTLEQADQISLRRRPSWLRLRISKLKIKIGKRLKRLRKGVLLGMSKFGLYRNILCHLKTWRGHFHGGATAAQLPQPLFT